MDFSIFIVNGFSIKKTEFICMNGIYYTGHAGPCPLSRLLIPSVIPNDGSSPIFMVSDIFTIFLIKFNINFRFFGTVWIVFNSFHRATGTPFAFHQFFRLFLFRWISVNDFYCRCTGRQKQAKSND